MAEVQHEIKVSVEKVVHDMMRDTAKALWERYGICLKSASFSWLDESTQSDRKMLVADVVLTTMTKS